MPNIDKITLKGTDYTIVDSAVPAWAKSATKPSYTASEISGLAAVATSGSYNDLSDKPYYVRSVTYDSPTRKIMTGMSGGRATTVVTLASVATSGSYNDLADKPTIPATYDDTALAARVTVLEGQTHNVTYNQSTTTLTIQ